MKTRVTAAAALTTLLLGIGGLAGPAQAAPSSAGTLPPPQVQPMNAQGCTLYPGGGSGCITIAGEDLTIYRATFTRAQVGNICDIEVQMRGVRANGISETWSRAYRGCSLDFNGAVWDNPGVFKRGSVFCGRSRDSKTRAAIGTDWGYWVCKTIG